MSRKMRRVIFYGVLLGLPLFMLETGWFNPERPWQEATGWIRLTPEQLPETLRSWPFQLQWLGHSGFLLQWHGQDILLDPNLSHRCTVVRRELELFPEGSQINAPDLALISHAHFDHFDVPTLTSLPGLGRVAGSPNLEHHLPASFLAKTRFQGLQPFQSLNQGPLRITAVPAQHGGNRFHPVHGAAKALGYMISDGETTLYFAGDTGKDLDFEALADQFHPQIAILPIGAFRPYWLLKPHHLSPEDAVAAARRLGVQEVVPCHFGTFRLALDDLTGNLPRFAVAAEAAKLPWHLPLPACENQVRVRLDSSK